MNQLNYQFLITILIILLGYAGKKLKLADKNTGDSLAKIIFNFTLPAVIITSIHSVKLEPSLLFFAVSGLIYGCFMVVCALYFFRKEKRQTRGMLSMLLPGFNVGLFAYPFVEAFWGGEGIKYFSIFDIGNALVIFGPMYIMGTWFSDGISGIDADIKGIFKKIIKSAPLIFYILSISINLAGLSLPAIILDMAGVLAKANTPLSLLTLGIFLEFSLDIQDLRNISKIMSIRLLTGAAAGYSMYRLLPLVQVARQSLLIAFILPVSFSVIPFAVELNYDRSKIAAIANISVVACIAILLVLINTGLI